MARLPAWIFPPKYGELNLGKFSRISLIKVVPKKGHFWKVKKGWYRNISQVSYFVLKNKHKLSQLFSENLQSQTDKGLPIKNCSSTTASWMRKPLCLWSSLMFELHREGELIGNHRVKCCLGTGKLDEIKPTDGGSYVLQTRSWWNPFFICYIFSVKHII